MSEFNYNNNEGPIPPSSYPYANQQADAPVPPHSSTQQPTASQQAVPTQHRQPASTAHRQEKGRAAGIGKTFLAGFLGAALACGIAGGGFVAWNASHSSSSTTVLGSSTNRSVSGSESSDRAVSVADKALPSVVAIDVYTSNGTTSSWGNLFDNGNGALTYSGLGSGVIISSDGYILTNNHVVEGADSLKVTASGQEYEAKVVGVDQSSDLAVLKIDATGLQAAEIGSSADLVPGQWVMTVGSPFGLEQSVATGIVSATSRTVTVENSSEGSSGLMGGNSGDVSVYSNMIQTDAAINPGNSGGALVDDNGKLIGINAVIESYSGSYSGVGFAIPIDYAMKIAQQIIDGKTPTHAQLGVAATSITSDIANRYDLDADEGAYLSAVYDGSSAAEAGLKEGDIITAVDDSKVSSSTDLVAACRSHQVGDKVSITYVRDGKTSAVDVQLGSDEQALGASSTEKSSSQQPNGGRGFSLGLGQGSFGEGGSAGSAQSLESAA